MNPTLITDLNKNLNQRNPNLRLEERGAPTPIKCDNCKKESHGRDRCWFLHPHLRLKKKGSNDRNMGERHEHNDERERQKSQQK